MTNLRSIQFRDSPNLDAFGRLRVGQPTMILDCKRVGSTPDIGMTHLLSVGGSTSYSQEKAATTITTGIGTDQIIRQTRQRAIYQPGKSLMALLTFAFGQPTQFVEKRVGLFDDSSGVFLSKNGADAPSFNIRRSISGSVGLVTQTQSAWTVDKLDGTGPSGKTLDLTKAQIVFIDLEWLGVGRVRCGFVIDGQFIVATEFLNSNIATRVYMQNPNLPLRWQINSTGAASPGNMDCICGSVSSEGGYETTGITASVDTGATGESIASNAFEEILAVRIRSAFVDFSTAFAAAVSVLASSNGAFLWRLVMSPTITDPGTWVNVGSHSIMEQNQARIVTEGTGILIACGFVGAAASAESRETSPILKLGRLIDGSEQDDLSLQVRNLSTAAETFHGSLSWREVY